MIWATCALSGFCCNARAYLCFLLIVLPQEKSQKMQVGGKGRLFYVDAERPCDQRLFCLYILHIPITIPANAQALLFPSNVAAFLRPQNRVRDGDLNPISLRMSNACV